MQHTHSNFPPEFRSLLEWIRSSEFERASLEIIRHRVTRAAQALMECSSEWAARAWESVLEIYLQLERDLVPSELLKRLEAEWSSRQSLVVSLCSLRRLAHSYQIALSA